MTTEVIIHKPQSEVIKLKRIELRAAREERKSELVNGLLLNPAVIYVALVLALEYLSTHPETGFEWFGTKDTFITKDTAKLITTGLTAGLAANALGGGAGIAQLIKAFR